jgi:peptide deformylase
MPKTIADLLLLGDPRLYERSEPVDPSELPLLREWVKDLAQVMEDFRKKFHFGRAIAAPQIGIMKRLIYMNVDCPLVLINPVLEKWSPDLFELWDDCMSFPHLMVRVNRHSSVVLRWLDEGWQEHEKELRGDLSELVQHEYDHLDGVLCTMRAIDEKSFKWRVL